MIPRQWKVLPRQHEDLVDQLLTNRGVPLKDKETFLNPQLDDLYDPLQLDGVTKASQRIKRAVKDGEKIIIYGDYDVDGVTATAVLWEAINSIGGQVLPYIPDRFAEGYGINFEAIKKLADEGNKLFISVDAGVTAYQQIKLANELGIDFIITDHHSLPKDLPPAYAIVHTTELAGVGVAYKLAQTLTEPALELVALGTIADVVPLLGENRILAKFGIESLQRTTRPGLLALYEEAAISRNRIGTYEIGFIIDPRLNAMGRLENAIDSLRLLLTRDPVRARELAKKLGATNELRRRKTLEMVDHARSMVADAKAEMLWVVSHSTYEQGIIGLIAGRLTEEWGRPVLAIAEGPELSKGSARSVAGFDITAAIASAADLLVTYGGHPQAAGFTIATTNIPAFRQRVQDYIRTKVKEEDLVRKLLIDAEVKPGQLNLELVKELDRLAPFGVGNPEPLFIAKSLTVGSMRLLSDNKHLKLELDGIDAIGFGLGPRGHEIRPGMKIDAIFHLEENVWQERSRLQLKLRDFQVKS